MIETPCDGAAQAEGQDHACEADGQGDAPVAGEKADVDLEGDQEEEDDQAEVGDVVEDGHGVCGKDVVLEARDSHHDRGSQQDAANDLRNDAGLAKVGQRVVEEAAEEDDDHGLDDEQVDGARGAVLDGVCALEDAGLGCDLAIATVPCAGGVDTDDGGCQDEERRKRISHGGQGDVRLTDCSRRSGHGLGGRAVGLRRCDAVTLRRW